MSEPIGLKALIEARLAKEISEQLLDGSFDEGVLNTEIERKLNELEERYEPRLTGIDNKIDEVGSHLKTEINEGLNSVSSQLMTELNFENGIWSWWTYPLAVYRDEKTFFGNTDDEGKVSINSYDHREKLFESAVLTEGEVDDHNAPSIIFTSDNKPMVFYSRHNKDALLRYRKGSINNSISSLGPEQTISMPGNVTYAQSFRHNEKIYLFTRVGSHSWYCLVSDDGGESWDINREFVNFGNGNQGYLKIKYNPSSGIVRIAFSGHPSIGNVHDIFYCYIRLSTGELVVNSQTVANINEGTGTIVTLGQLHKVYDSNVTGKKARLFDIGSSLEIVFADFTDDTDGEYKYAAWNGTGFDIKNVVQAGSIIGGGEDRQYFGGMHLPHGKSNELLLSRESEGIWYIERWKTADNGDTWTKTVIEKSDTQKLFRPIAPIGGSEDVMWVDGQYSESSYTDFDVGIKYLLSNLFSMGRRIEEIEVRENSRGKYRKWPDGTLECWTTEPLTMTYNSSSVMVSTWIFPYPPTSIEFVNHSPTGPLGGLSNDSARSAMINSTISANSLNCQLRLVGVSDTFVVGDKMDTRAYAIGTWK